MDDGLLAQKPVEVVHRELADSRASYDDPIGLCTIERERLKHDGGPSGASFELRLLIHRGVHYLLGVIKGHLS
jgi:hypothetical protein